MKATLGSARQARADDTRRRLITAAAELFAERGYADTTIAEIVRRAGVAKGTFFTHFNTKEAVVADLVGIQVKLARRAREQTLAARSATPLDGLRAVLHSLAEQAGASRALTRAVLGATLETELVGDAADALFGELMKTLVKDVRDAQSAGLLDGATRPIVIASTLIASYLGAAFSFACSPRSPRLVEFLRPIIDVNLAAFQPSREVHHAPSSPPRPRAPARRRARPRVRG